MYKWMRLAKFISLFLSGVVLCYLSFRKIELGELWHLLQQGNYWVCIPVYIVSVSGYCFRVQRWRLMLESVKTPASFKGPFVALCTGYFVSYGVPRLGEITRCLMLKKTDQVPFEKSFLTIVVERLMDTLVLLILLILVFVINSGTTVEFFRAKIVHPLSEKLDATIMISVLGLAMLVLIVFNRFLNKRFSEDTFTSKWNEIKESLLALLGLKAKVAFTFYTVLIWFCYYLMTYLWIFTFEESSSLGIKEVFVVMVVGSIGRSVPIQGGGMGAYHYLVSQCFAVLGIGLLTGNALAIVIHGAQSILTLITGIVCGGWFLLRWRNT